MQACVMPFHVTVFRSYGIFDWWALSQITTVMWRNENVPSYVSYFHPPQDTCTHVSSPFSVTEEELPERVSYQVPAQ